MCVSPCHAHRMELSSREIMRKKLPQRKKRSRDREERQVQSLSRPLSVTRRWVRNESPLSLPLPIAGANKACADTTFSDNLLHLITRHYMRGPNKQRAALDLHKLREIFCFWGPVNNEIKWRPYLYSDSCKSNSCQSVRINARSQWLIVFSSSREGSF